MANKVIQVDLQFRANTEQAQRSMQQLQQQLSQLSTNTSLDKLSMTPQLEAAREAAMRLKIALNNATNVDTGKLNLNKFQAELSKAGLTIQDLAKHMEALGPEGVKSFQALSQQISQADTRLFNLSGKAKKLVDTFANTLRWKIASGAIMGVTSAIRETVQYAAELDKSLNSIREVTGKSADTMARFAREANAAAKDLGTTTTKYTDASLIYYRQGLNDKEVKERTNTTVKLANVTGKTASEVSEWMTSIWNNFDDGSKSLEHYADVITKLGASTASSAEEIATGLTKFAAVAENVGLSYEYATSALATVTAETRQSAEVVGTAFKTLFSRMEQLKQGDTLDDGTTLGQYSLALEKVGVSIKDASGGLKDMDTILQETGARWKTLSRDQQVALSQQVAGIRQYNQFMALMSNWDVMEKNVKLTKEANGALQMQNEIYQESEEAAKNKLTAQAESFKSLFVSGKDLNKLYTILADVLEVIERLFKSFGGLRTIILAAVAALSKMYQPQIADFFTQMGVKVKTMGESFKHFGTSINSWVNGNGFFHGDKTFQTDTAKLSAEMLARQVNHSTDTDTAESTLSLKSSQVNVDYANNQNKLNEAGKQLAEWKKQELDYQAQLLIEQDKQLSKEKELAEQEGERISKELKSPKAKDAYDEMIDYAETAGKNEFRSESMLGAAQQAKSFEQTSGPLSEQSKMNLGEDLNKYLKEINGTDQITQDEFDKMSSAIKEFSEEGKMSLDELIEKLKEFDENIKKVNENKIDDLATKTMAKENKVNPLPTAKEADKMQIKSNSSVETIDKGLDQVNSKKLNKTQKAQLKALKDETKQVKALKKERDAMKKGTEEARKADDKYQKALGNLQKKAKDFKKELKFGTKEIVENGKKTKDNAKTQEALGKNIDKVSEKYDELGNKIKNGSLNQNNWANSLTKGISSMATYAMGVSMLTGAFESLGSAVGHGTLNWKDFMSFIPSVLMSLTTLIPVIVSTTAALRNKARASKEAAQQSYLEGLRDKTGIPIKRLKTIALKQEASEADNAKLKKQGLAVAEVAEGFAGAAAQAGKGWAGIAAAIAALAIIIPIASSIFGFSASVSTAQSEEKEKDVESGIENLKAIEETQKEAKAVSDLTKEYNRLKAAGESTQEVLGKMKDQIPSLIESYKKLGDTLGIAIDTKKLEEAYEYFQKTGDISVWEKVQKQTDDYIKEVQTSTAQITTSNALDVFNEKAGTNFTSAGEAIDDYNEKLKQKMELEKEYNAESLKNNSEYQQLVDDLKKYSEAMPNLIEAQRTQFQLEEDAALENLASEKKFNEEVFSTLDDNITNVETYMAKREQLIERLMTLKGWTEDEAKDYLSKSSLFGGFEAAADLFGENGSKLGAQFAGKVGPTALKKIQDWFANLPEDQRTLAMGIDFTLVTNEEDVQKMLEKIKDEMRIATAKAEAKELGADETVFETYAETLTLTNENLKDNRAAAYEVAAANYRVNKGLEDLNKTWSESIKKVRQNTIGTYEYAEGIGEIAKALKTMFGVKPSTKFITQHLDDLEKMLNGDNGVLDKLQDDLAKDFVEYQFRVEPEVVFGEDSSLYQEADTIKNALQEALDSLGNIEIGENVELSGNYLNVLQTALDAGQITQEQLEQAFQIKGYDVNFTTHQVPGPKMHYRREYQYGDDNPYSEGMPKVVEWNEQSWMTVPLIGESQVKEAKGGESGPSFNAVKTTSGSSLATSVTKSNADKTKDKLKSLDKEKDRYHEITKVINNNEKSLERLGKVKDRVYGAKALAIMDKEIEKQKQLIKNNETLLQEAKAYLEQDRQKLLDNWDVELDETGRITNYEEIQDRYINQLKNSVNNETLNSQIQKEYDNFKDAATKYEETLEKVEDQADKVNDELDKLYEFNLEKITTTIQIKVDIADDEKAYIDFLMQQYEDDPFAAAEKINLLGKTAETVQTKINANLQGVDDIYAALAKGDITEAQAVEQLRTLRDELIDLNKEFQDIGPAVKDALTEELEAWIEKIDKAKGKIDFFGAALSHYKNIIDIVGKDNLGISNNTIRELSKAQISNTQDALRTEQSKLDALRARREGYIKSRADALAKNEDTKIWDDMIEDLDEKIQDSAQSTQDAFETALEAIKEDFETTAQLIAEEFSEAAAGIYDNLEDLRSSWDRQQETADRYLSTYQQTYEINKLNRKIQQDIDKTDSLKSQKELHDLQQEILNMTKDGQQVSKNDLELLQKKYDLMIAEQALRDAQNAKSVVRLQRDSQGNYNYVYTADSNTTDQAQQAYDDKLYALESSSDKILKNLTEQGIKLNEWAYQQIEEAAKLYGKGTEPFDKEVERIKAKYNEDWKYILNETEKVVGFNMDIYKKYSADLATTYNETYIGQIWPDYQNFETFYTNTTSFIDTAIHSLQTANEDVQKANKKTLELAKQDYLTFKTDVVRYYQDIEDESARTGEAAEKMADDMENARARAVAAAEAILDEYNTAMPNIRDQIDKTITKINNFAQSFINLADAANAAADAEIRYQQAKGQKQSTIDTIGGGFPSGQPSNKKGNTAGRVYQLGYNTTSGEAVYKIITPKDEYKTYSSKDLVISEDGKTAYFIKDAKTPSEYKGSVKWEPEKVSDGVSKNSNNTETLNSYPISSFKPFEIKTGNVNMWKFDKNGKLISEEFDKYAIPLGEHDGKRTSILGGEILGYQKDTIGPYNIRPYKVKLSYQYASYNNNGELVEGTEEKHLNEVFWVSEADARGLAKIEQSTYGEQRLGDYLKLPIISAKTGGYTGEWGPEGRLAMLHQKELILNAHDTENMLAAVNIVRSISDQLERNALMIQYQSEFARINSNIKTSGDTLQQEVTIHAEFPNATNHNEIEEAFKNLTNYASQYANRKF